MMSRRDLARVLAFEARAYLRTGLLLHGQKSPAIPGARRDARLDVLFVPGVAATPSQFWDLRHALEGVAAGFDAFEYGSFRHPREIAEALGAHIEASGARTGRPVLVIGHSLGGLLLRIALQRDALPKHVAGFVSICAPLHGTRLSRLVPGSPLRALAPEGPLFAELERTRSRLDGLLGRTLTVGARFDSFITPYESAFLEGSERLLLRDVGHVGSLFDPRVFRAVINLAERVERSPEAGSRP